MKLTTNLKAILTKTAMVGLVAGAALMAAPQKANAQVAIGIHFGHRPVYVAPAPYYVPPVAYGPAYVAPAYGYYGYDRGYYHRDRFYRDRRWR